MPQSLFFGGNIPSPTLQGSVYVLKPLEALAGQDPDLDPFIHLFMLHRGILLTPFHNMLLLSPETTAAQVRQHTAVLEEAVQALLG